MQVRRKLEILADAAKYDASCASGGTRRAGSDRGIGSTQGMGICHSYTPDGRCVSLLKVLLTNVCTFDCKYCINRISSDVPRATFEIDELVGLTLEFYRRNYIEGLFLSSGIIGSPDETMQRLCEVARRLREDHHFGGYIHLKAVAGASPELLVAAGRHADRLSANIELPTQDDLDRLAPAKRTADIEASMRSIRDAHEAARADTARSAPAFAPAGQSTQMIVGATPSSDRDVLSTAARLYDRYALRRIYYSAYSPIPVPSPGLPNRSPPLVREHRLYQADYLLRSYGFSVDDLVDETRPFLDLEVDPKLTWALAHRAAFPVVIEQASQAELLRVPGIGVRSARRILAARRHRALRLDDLRRLGVSLRRAGPFVVTADANPALQRLDALQLAKVVPSRQLSLFEPES